MQHEGMVEAQSLRFIFIRVYQASGCVMRSQVDVKRSTCGGATAIRIKVECLRCGHGGALDETDLPRGTGRIAEAARDLVRGPHFFGRAGNRGVQGDVFKVT
jgi:hypothetical protein